MLKSVKQSNLPTKQTLIYILKHQSPFWEGSAPVSGSKDWPAEHKLISMPTKFTDSNDMEADFSSFFFSNYCAESERSEHWGCWVSVLNVLISTLTNRFHRSKTGLTDTGWPLPDSVLISVCWLRALSVCWFRFVLLKSISWGIVCACKIAVCLFPANHLLTSVVPASLCICEVSYAFPFTTEGGTQIKQKKENETNTKRLLTAPNVNAMYC